MWSLRLSSYFAAQCMLRKKQYLESIWSMYTKTCPSLTIMKKTLQRAKRGAVMGCTQTLHPRIVSDDEGCPFS